MQCTYTNDIVILSISSLLSQKEQDERISPRSLRVRVQKPESDIRFCGIPHRQSAAAGRSADI